MRKKLTRNYLVGTGHSLLLKVWEGLSFAFILTACQTAQIPNVQFTGSLGSQGAVQFDLLDSKTANLTLTQFASYWNDLGNPKGPPVCMRASDWASLKMALEKLCSWAGQGTCTAQQEEALTHFTNELTQEVNKTKGER